MSPSASTTAPGGPPSSEPTSSAPTSSPVSSRASTLANSGPPPPAKAATAPAPAASSAAPPPASTSTLLPSSPLSAASPAFLPSPPLSAASPVFSPASRPLSVSKPNDGDGVNVQAVPRATAEAADDNPAVTPSEEGSGHATPLGEVPRPSKKATVSELRTVLERLGMDSRGKKETLFKRLMAAHCRQQDEQAMAAREAALAASGLPEAAPQPHLSYLCFDVEATCMSGRNSFDYPNEIIEFPVVLMQWVYDVETEDESEPAFIARRRRRVNARLAHVDTFHSYVRPTWRPQLSTFCTNLTGIQQSTVDASPTFPEMLNKFEDWLNSWGLLENDQLKNAIWVTDGPWDLKDFVPKQLHITPTKPPRYPKYFVGPFLNIKAAVRTVLSEERRRKQLGNPPLPRITTGRHARRQEGSPMPPLTITGQLTELGVGEFEGRQHSGIADATNISRILRAIADRGVLIEPNAVLPPASNSKRWPWMGAPGEVLWNTPADPIGVIEADLIRLTLDDMVSPNKQSATRGLAAICATT